MNPGEEGRKDEYKYYLPIYLSILRFFLPGDGLGEALLGFPVRSFDTDVLEVSFVDEGQ